MVFLKFNLLISVFFDIFFAGGFGVDFSHNIDNVEEGINKVAKNLLEHGVTAFCPTIVTSSKETYRKVLPKITRTNGGISGAAILGVHVEGPFISPRKKGAHEEILIRQFDKVRETNMLKIYFLFFLLISICIFIYIL